MLSLLGFLIILAPLVIVHEFGHFLFAKLFNVRADAFSLGFGPVIWKKKIGETQFRLSAIPLGGYVKLLGEDPEQELPPEEKKRALHQADRWKRFLIYFGGPLFNFVFAALLFMAIGAIGEPKLSNVIGRIIPDTPAQEAGLKSGDRITKIADKQMKLSSEIFTKISEHPNETLEFEVQRNGSTLNLEVPIGTQEGYSQYGEEKMLGHLKGLYPFARTTEVGVSNPNSLAGAQKIKTGDEVLAINGQEVKHWETLEVLYKKLPLGEPFELEIKSEDDKRTVEILKPKSSKSELGLDLGLHSSELFVEQPVDGSPAIELGIKKGDRLVSIQGNRILSFFALKDTIQEAAKDSDKIEVVWEREGALTKVNLVPKKNKERDPLLKEKTVYTIGVVPMLKNAEPETVVERTFNPFVLAYTGTARMLDFTWRNLVSIGKMIVGDVSVASLGGPILIGKIAGSSLERGLISFLTTMAILSVGLGLLNVLPIPVLDGGHILLLGIESVRGRPLSLRQIAIAQQVGLSLIILLMVVVMRNDLARLALFD